MERLLNFNEPIDVNLLDAVVVAFYTSTNPQERSEAQKVLTALQEHPDAWLRVDTILEYSRQSNTKFFALGILDSVIKYRWGVLPREQCEGIRKYIVNLIIKLSSDDATLSREKVFITKLDTVLVQIIKKEWPRNWETFIPEIVSAGRANESLCENNMTILRLISEEVFDFSSGQMTQHKTRELKTSLNKEFILIYQLCEYVLENSQRQSLITVTLQTLLRFLNWIPLGYIFETKMIETLVFKFFPVAMFRNVTLECLTEVACLAFDSFDNYFCKLFIEVMVQLRKVIPPETNIAHQFEVGTEDEEKFVRLLSLFLTGFFKTHPTVMESPENQPVLLEAHWYLTSISLVDDDEIFKICLEYWNKLASDLYHESPQVSASPLLLGNVSHSVVSARKQLYAPVLSRVRLALIKRMPRPEEVLIVEDENGEIVKETMKDSDAITLYKSMRETLVFLTHLDYEDMQNKMLEKLVAQVDGSEWSWNNLNTLCWAIGAISGAQTEDHEKRFLVTVIRDLLGLVEMKRGKDNKAVIASNIMYIVGNYPRFLRAHWKFLKTVANKLFEFMHESHPGVQDMACDTFLRIAQKCRRKFVMVQVGETVPFIEEILGNLPQIISDLEPQQIHTFYEAIGYMIQSHTVALGREAYISDLMKLPNQTWSTIMAQASQNIQTLVDPTTVKQLQNILRTNVRACTSLGHCYISQLGRLYLDMLNVYKAMSEMISNTIASGGTYATSTTAVRSMRSVKKEILKLVETFVEKSEDPHVVSTNFIPPLFEAVLGDYQRNIPDARDPEVLSVMAAIVNKLQAAITKDIPRIFGSVFDCTLEMITKNFTDYPEHRLHFFTLLKAITSHCFQAFFTLSSAHFKLVIDSIVWAFKHTERQISETGLNILIELLKNISSSGPEVSASFYKLYFLSLMQDIFYVLTDTFHKSGFKLQSTLLSQMVEAVEVGVIQVPLWDSATVQDPAMTNQKFLRQYITNLLGSAFTNLTPNQLQHFVTGLFALTKDLTAFKAHLRDFLVQLKEFAGNNEDLYLEEKEAAIVAAKEAEEKRAKSVPGLIPQNQLPDDMNDY